MSDRILFSILGGIVIFGGLWILDPETTTMAPSTSASPLQARKNIRSLAATPALTSSETKSNANLNVPTEKKEAPEALESDLAHLKTLTDQIFPPEENKRIQKDLYQKAELVMSASLYLRNLTAYEENLVLKNAAIDFLLAAVKEGNKLADEEIRDIILDARIENENISRFERESLAGVQAELLYGWSADTPERLTELEPQLPGPISRKIWGNVKNAQENNHLESIAEAKLNK